MSHTYAILAVSQRAYDEILSRLIAVVDVLLIMVLDVLLLLHFVARDRVSQRGPLSYTLPLGGNKRILESPLIMRRFREGYSRRPVFMRSAEIHTLFAT